MCSVRVCVCVAVALTVCICRCVDGDMYIRCVNSNVKKLRKFRSGCRCVDAYICICKSVDVFIL